MTIAADNAALFRAKDRTELEMKTQAAKSGEAYSSDDFLVQVGLDYNGEFCVSHTAIGTREAIDRFAINLAFSISGDALSPGEGFPTVVETDGFSDILLELQGSIVELPGTSKYEINITAA